MNTPTWYGILELAERYGWQPMGTAPSEDSMAGLSHPSSDLNTSGYWNGNHWNPDGQLVLFEDALNLVDALEQAFIHHEPARLRSLHEFWIPYGNDEFRKNPGIGVIQHLISFCQLGPFLIEKS